MVIDPLVIDYDKIATDYARHRQVHPEVLKQLLANLQSSARVLDVGCGTGNYIVALNSLTDCVGYGVDPSTEMLARANEHAQGVKFSLGRAEQLDFSPGFFDLVFTVDVIHHVKNRLSYFRGANRVLKPGGIICTVTDSEEVIRRREPLATYFPETVEADLRRYPSLAQLKDFMVQAGFGQLAEDTVEFTYQFSNLQIYRDRAFSVLHLISEEAFQRGLARLEQDLRQTGSIQAVSRYSLLWGKKMGKELSKR